MSTFEFLHFSPMNRKLWRKKRTLIRSKTKCFILSLSFFTQFCTEGVANVPILAGNVPASTER